MIRRHRAADGSGEGVQQRLQILCDLASTTRLSSPAIFMLCLLGAGRRTSPAALARTAGKRCVRTLASCCGAPRCGLYGKFAGILQVEFRQGVSGIRMLLPILGEGSLRSYVARDPCQHRRRAYVGSAWCYNPDRATHPPSL